MGAEDACEIRGIGKAAGLPYVADAHIGLRKKPGLEQISKSFALMKQYVGE